METEVAQGRFREDLYYRLNMVELRVPPLRQRAEDIPELIEYFSRRFATQYSRPAWRPSGDALQRFCEYPWPGNVRQLAQVIEQSYVLDCTPAVPETAPKREQALATPFLNLERLRNESIRQALRVTRGHKGRAARLLGVHPNTLTRLLSRFEVAITLPDGSENGSAPCQN